MGGSHSNNSYSDGVRSGKIIKLSKSGFFWKTYEGEMLCDGLSQSKTQNGDVHSVANVWRFSIDGKNSNADEIAQKIKNNMSEGKSTEVNYLVPYIATPCRGSTQFYVQSIK